MAALALCLGARQGKRGGSASLDMEGEAKMMKQEGQEGGSDQQAAVSTPTPTSTSTH